MYATRMITKPALHSRAEVLNNIRHSPKQPGDTRLHLQKTGGQASLQVPRPGLDPEYTLTEDEVNRL